MVVKSEEELGSTLKNEGGNVYENEKVLMYCTGNNVIV